jgi:hypothetical protein
MVSLHLWKNYIHALSQVDFHHGPGRELPGWALATPSDREHVASLDGLALLLVFRSQRDVAAVSYWQSANGLKLLWAKNEPVDDHNTHNYIKELLDNVQRSASTGDLLDIVISMCKEKILHRVKKLAKSFDVSQTNQRQNESNLWQFDKTKEPCQMLEAMLERAGRLESNESVVNLLDRFTRFVGRITKDSKAADLWTILCFSTCVSSVASLDTVLEENQARYLSKLGDYVRILERIPLMLTKVDKAKITVEQVMT